MGERFTVTLTMRRPTWLARLWYRRLGSTPPLAEASTGPFRGELARLVPYRFRAWHHWYADTFGYFWIGCPLCGWEFGGHESGDSVPDPTRAPTGGMTICSRCTIARNRGGMHA